MATCRRHAVSNKQNEPIVLTSGPLELAICPSLGGSIARFEFIEAGRSTPILRGGDGTPASVLGSASFPLVPFVNRIAGGRFTFRGREIALIPNMAGDPSPLHGQGWLSPWSIVSTGTDHAQLLFEHAAGEWPWSYAARQEFSLDAGALEIRLTCQNRSPDPMPCGLGQHPYFHCTDKTRLRTEVANVWTIDEDILPVERIAAAGRFDISDGPVCGRDLDHGFDGWRGTAVISDPALPFEVHLSSPDARFFQLYSPMHGGIFVAEPVTHANAALNAREEQWGELGMRILAPEAEMALAMRIEIRRVEAPRSAGQNLGTKQSKFR